MSSAWFAVGMSALTLASGCAVDDRTLELGSGADSGAAGKALSGTGGSSGLGYSSGGSRSIEPVEIPRCFYDGSVEAECETLVENAGFEADTRGWMADDGSYESWEEINASGTEASGSIGLLNAFHGKAGGYAPGAARQCLPARPDHFYDFAGDLFIPEGQGEGIDGEMFEGMSGVGVFFFAEDNCAGESIDNFDSKLVTETGVWVHVTGTAVAPDQAASVLIRLLTLKPMRQFVFKTTFDNVFVRER